MICRVIWVVRMVGYLSVSPKTQCFIADYEKYLYMFFTLGGEVF